MHRITKSLKQNLENNPDEVEVTGIFEVSPITIIKPAKNVNDYDVPQGGTRVRNNGRASDYWT